ncbi:MAG: hypothetical protein NTY19_10495 [Planctomycetota bacterium]|nr:hypothetical protein [Planctomycetota bacterium]
MRNSDKFLLGCSFAVVAFYLFYDSGGAGAARSGIVAQSLREVLGSSSSSIRGLMLLLCVPSLLGFLALLHDDQTKWAWSLVGISGVLLITELLSRFNLFPNFNLLRLLSLIAAIVPGVAPPPLNQLLATASTLALQILS